MKAVGRGGEWSAGGKCNRQARNVVDKVEMRSTLENCGRQGRNVVGRGELLSTGENCSRQGRNVCDI